MCNWLRFLGLALFITAAGCGFRDPSMPELVPVTGTVTLNGKPLPGAVLTFLPTNEKQGGGAVGFTDPEGKYSLQTVHGGEGSPRGPFRVTISKMVMPDGSDIPVGANIDEMEVGTRQKLPEKYSSIDLTELTKSVPDEGGTIDFELSMK